METTFASCRYSGLVFLLFLNASIVYYYFCLTETFIMLLPSYTPLLLYSK